MTAGAFWEEPIDALSIDSDSAGPTAAEPRGLESSQGIPKLLPERARGHGPETSDIFSYKTQPVRRQSAKVQRVWSAAHFEVCVPHRVLREGGLLTERAPRATGGVLVRVVAERHRDAVGPHNGPCGTS